MTWSREELHFGLGEQLGQGELLGYKAPLVEINAVSFSAGAKSAATWKMFRETGKCSGFFLR